MIKCGYNPMREAKQLGILYHFTSLGNIVKIINSNKLIINDCDDLITGVSLTRNRNLSRGGATSVRISLDGDKLSNNYKIVPINHQVAWEEQFHAGYDQRESEERVLSDINNLKNYIISVDIHTKAINDPKVIKRANNLLRNSSVTNIEELLSFLDKHHVRHGTYGRMSDRG